MVMQSFFWGGGGKHGARRSMTCENGELTNIQIRSVSSLQDVIDKSKQKLKPIHTKAETFLKTVI